MRGRELRVDVSRVRVDASVARANALALACGFDGEIRAPVTARVGARAASDDGVTVTLERAASFAFRQTSGRARAVDRSARGGVRIDVRDVGGRAVGTAEAAARAGAGWTALRNGRGGVCGAVYAVVRERMIGVDGADGADGVEGVARGGGVEGGGAGARARGTRRDDARVVVSDDEDELPAFEGEGEGTAVGGDARAFELTARLESFERLGASETFDFGAAVAASVGVDDDLADALGIDRARAECLVRTAPSARAAARAGDVVVFPSGEDSISFSLAPSELATTLAGKPVLLLDVWSVADSSRTASAEIVIDELLRRPEVRYRVEVVDEDGVVVGRVRLYVRLEARGDTKTASAPKTPPHEKRKATRALSPPPIPSAQKPPQPASQAQTRHAVPPQNDERVDPRSGVEYKVAYDLEVWKQHQMTKFYEELRSKEAVRMNILEDEWRRHETRRAREAEEGANRVRVLEKKLHEAAMSLETRERKLIELEENFDHRKHKLERETSVAREEAKDAIRRHQEACEHRLEMEKQKAREAIRERDSLHRRLEHAEAQLMEVQSAFAAHKKASLETNEAALQAEISRLLPRCEAAEAHAIEEAESKERYKSQLTKMARQVVALERERAHLRRAVERAGLNVSTRMQVAPSANEFMNEMLAGEGAEADAFMSSFRADIAAASGPGAFVQATAVRTAPRAREPIRPPASPKFERVQEDVIREWHPDDVEEKSFPKFTSGEATLLEKRAAEKEVRRLVTERGELMRTGMYGSGDKIIALIDERIEELTDRIASA